MTRNVPYVRHRETPRQKLDKAAQIQRDQRTNALIDKAKKLELPERGLEGFVYSLAPGLLRVEKPASPDIVEAYVRMQSAAHELHKAMESVGRNDVQHCYLAANVDRVKKDLTSLLRPDKPRSVDGEALFASDAGLVRFSFNSKSGRPIDYATELACEAALAWRLSYKRWPSSRGESGFHKMLKFACEKLLGIVDEEVPGRTAVQAGVALCKQRWDKGWSGGRVHSAVDAAGTLQIRANKI
jgi:hypothetical protein